MPADKPKNSNPNFEWVSTGLAAALFFTACFFLTKWALELGDFSREPDRAVQALKLIGLGVCAVLAVFSFIGMFAVWFNEADRVGKVREKLRILEKARLNPWDNKDKH